MSDRASRPSRRSSPALAAWVVTSALAIGLAGHLASAAPPRPSASAASYGSASASASASDRPDAVPSGSVKPWVPIPVASFPTERSAKPTKQEWAIAAVATEARVTEPSCALTRIREWYRLECTLLAMQLVAGTRDELDIAGRKESADQSFYSSVSAVFPARPGDRRYFEMFRWSKWAPGTPDALASVVWLDGEAAPTITIEGLRWGI